MTLAWLSWGLRQYIYVIAISMVEQLVRMTSVVLIVFTTNR